MDGFGVQGRWMASFTIGGVPIVDIKGFESFKLVSEAGNQVPTFELIFRTVDTSMISLINEGNVISAGLGVQQIDMSGIPLRPMSKDISRGDSSTIRLQITGFYDAIDYMLNTQTMMSDKMSGVNFMQQIVGKHFKPDFDGATSNDSMNWSQPGISDKDMVQELWTRSDFGSNNFGMIGIDQDGTFRCRTATQLTSGSYNWNFSNTIQPGSNTVPFHMDYNIKSDTGFQNFAAAYSKSSDIIDQDKGPGNIFTTTPGQLFGQSSSLEQSSQVAAQVAGSLFSNENHHSNFHQAHADNVTNLANASSTKLYCSNSDFFFPIKLLDVILFTDELIDSTSIQSFSGSFIVTEITRHIENNQFHTLITAVRESVNNVQTSS